MAHRVDRVLASDLHQGLNGRVEADLAQRSDGFGLDRSFRILMGDAANFLGYLLTGPVSHLADRHSTDRRILVALCNTNQARLRQYSGLTR